MKPNIITISFKNTIEDIKLYSWIISKSSLSGFIKDVLNGKIAQKGYLMVSDIS